MSAKKQIIIVCMVSIVTAICMIFAIFSGNEPLSEKSLNEAQKYFDSMDYDHAIAIYNDILRTDKQSSTAYLGLAEAYLKKGNEIKAIEILERGLPYAGNNMRFYNMLSELTGETYYAEVDDDLLGENMTDDEILPSVQHTEETIFDPEDEDYEDYEDYEEDELDFIDFPEIDFGTEPAVTETAAPVVNEEPVPAATTVSNVIVQETQPAAAETTTAKAMVEVPDFTGMSQNDAVRLAQSLNIELKLEYKENNNYENDIVYDQGKKAGETVQENTSITVYVAVNTQPTEEELNVQKFFNAVKAWGELNSDKVKNVTLKESSSTVTISMSSIKRLTIDSDVMEAFAECKNAVMVINSSSAAFQIKSSSVTKADKLNLSTDIYGNDKRTSVKIGSSGNLNCTVSVTILKCDIDSSELKDMNLYYNNKKVDKINVDSNDNPVMTISSGGQYTIR